MTAVIKVPLCRAIVKVASAVPYGLAFGSYLAAAYACFIKEELTSIAVDAAD